MIDNTSSNHWLRHSWAVALALPLLGLSAVAATRDTIQIVGSSTVYPFVTVVAERFGRSAKYSAPIVESTGSGGGLKLFCSGLGPSTPDISNSSRRITPSEYRRCLKYGVSDILEVKVGYDGLVFASSREAPVAAFSLRQLYLALARRVPATDGRKALVSNPYRKWSDIDPSLPDRLIRVFGPPPTSGTRDAFVELALEGGCASFDWIKALQTKNKRRYRSICRAIREDGAYIEAGENDNLIVQKLVADPAVFGIFGFSFLKENLDRVRGAEIAGTAPSFANIGDGVYPLSRPLYFYVKKAHIGIIPGIDRFVREFTSKRAVGSCGYLLSRGLIPLGTEERAAIQQDRRGPVQSWPSLKL